MSFQSPAARHTPALVVLSALALLVSWPAQAQGVRVDRIEIVASGFYTAEPTGRTHQAPGSVAGKWSELEKVEFLERAPAVTARVGTGFGVRFKPIGRRKDAEVTLRTVWRIPAPGVTNPDNGNTYRQSTSEFKARIDAVSMRGYTFDNDWEVVPGVWVLEIWQGDRKLIEQSFAIGSGI